MSRKKDELPDGVSMPLRPELGKTCFIVSPIGREGTPERRHADLFFRHLIEPVLAPMGYDVIRADTIDVGGVITTQIIKHLRHADLVVADLSFHNPNVFYELAIRHIVAKPFVHMIRKEDTLPFDVAPQRAIFFDLTDLDSVAAARQRLGAQASEYEEGADSSSPVSEHIRFEQVEATDATIAAQLESLYREVRSLGRRIDLVSSPVIGRSGGGEAETYRVGPGVNGELRILMEGKAVASAAVSEIVRYIGGGINMVMRNWEFFTDLARGNRAQLVLPAYLGGDTPIEGSIEKVTPIEEGKRMRVYFQQDVGQP